MTGRTYPLHPEPLFTFTPAFEKHLEKMASPGLKVGLKKVGCNGYSYTFVTLTEMEALFMHVHDVQVGTKKIVFEDDNAWLMLKHSTFDYVRQGLNFKIQITNPNAKGQCGCGESVNFD